MPEIPEMEIYKDYLNKWVKGKQIIDVKVVRNKSLNLDSHEFCRNIRGKRIENINRKGKYLIFQLDDLNFLLTHMMLDGRLYLIQENILEVMRIETEELKQRVKGLPGKTSVILNLANDSLLFFCNLTLGYLHYLKQDELDAKLNELGVDPSASEFSPQLLAAKLQGKRGMIKPWLMNPRNIAGVGNAYSNEALFVAGILPTRLISKLNDTEKITLFKELNKVLRDSIRLGGDMEEPFAAWDDFTGGYNSHFKVYERVGKPCPVCNHIIVKSEVGGRNAFYCPNCQK